MRPHRALLHATTRRAALIGIFAFLVACDSLATFEPQVIVDTDLFVLQAREVTNVTATVTYNWTNAQTQARVHHATTTTGAGSASIRVLDAAGSLVYSNGLEKDVTQLTAIGVPGSWTIVVTMTGFSGTLGFHILAGAS